MTTKDPNTELVELTDDEAEELAGGAQVNIEGALQNGSWDRPINPSM